MMAGEASRINWTSMPTAVPCFLTIIFQPFTLSMANGIYAGLASRLVLFLLCGEALARIRWVGGSGWMGSSGHCTRGNTCMASVLGCCFIHAAL
jgi:xanthine/uracil/vitamin C permease (AzgA family)